MPNSYVRLATSGETPQVRLGVGLYNLSSANCSVASTSSGSSCDRWLTDFRVISTVITPDTPTPTLAPPSKGGSSGISRFLVDSYFKVTIASSAQPLSSWADEAIGYYYGSNRLLFLTQHPFNQVRFVASRLTRLVCAV